MEWQYVDKPEEKWLGTTICRNTGAKRNPEGSPAVEGEKPFTHEQRTPTS
jgi:Mn-containing catalase